MMVTIGETPYISTLPLYVPLRRLLGREYVLVSNPLTDVSEALARGEIDIGPITLVDYFCSPEAFVVLPRLSLSSLGRSGCALLCSVRPAYELREAHIAVPRCAVGAVALLRWLMREMYRFEPTFVECSSGFDESLAEHDAVLLVQDQALKSTQEPTEHYQVWDLGEAWWQITNTPLLYMLWVARQGLPDETIAAAGNLFFEARQAFSVARRDIVAEAQRRVGLSEEVLTGYLGRFNYDFTAAHQEGLELYRHTVAN